MMKNALNAIRANAIATIELVDGLLAMIAEIEKAEHPEPVPPAMDYSASTCPHPADARRAIPRMGAPNAYVCGLCGQAGGTEEALARPATPEKEG